jgi:hypothetical protein
MKGTTRAGRYHLQPSGHRAFIRFQYDGYVRLFTEEDNSSVS